MTQITLLIDRWKNNDNHALDHLIAVAYSRLHTSARQVLGHYGNNVSLQSTELVSELYLHFREQKNIKFENAQHFFAIAALKLRQILNTRHEKNTAKKRNYGKKENITQIDNNPGKPSYIENIILNGYLDLFESIDPVNARVLELKLFWEFDNSEVANILGVSESSVHRRWKTAKAVIAKKINENERAIDSI